MNPLDGLTSQVNELVSSFQSTPMFGSLDAVGFTQYSFWFAVAIAVLLILLFVFKAKQAKSLAPKGRFVNLMEYLVEFIRDSMCKELLHTTWKKHFPFIATVFLVILTNNMIGIIPGMKPGTGTISMTGALALISFVYFIVCGIKVHGAGGYVKSLAPEGVAFPINVVVWAIEVFSTFLRLITLAVRLFCNLFAGHIVLGIFAILTSLFFTPITQALTGITVAEAGASLLWLLLLVIIYIVEIMVAAIQAYVFALLSAVYIQIAESHE